MGIPLRQRVVYKVAQLFQTSSFLILSWLKKQYLLFVFIVGRTPTGIHGRVLLCFTAVL